jgi:hypothetical protein
VTFHRGDVVSLSRAQSNRVSILSTPVGPGPEVYSVTLPINGVPIAFEYEAAFGSTLNQIADGLLAVLDNEQTVYSTAIDTTPWAIVIVGPIGQAFEITTSDNVGIEELFSAWLKVDTRTGRPIGPIRLLEVNSTLERLRVFSTRDRDGNTLMCNLLQGRELDTSDVYDFDASEVLTILHQEGT